MNSIDNFAAVLVGRIVFGFCTGLFTVAAPRIIEETVPTYLMGEFGISTNLALAFG